MRYEAQRSGFRVGETHHILGNKWATDIMENATGDCILTAFGLTEPAAESIAEMTVCCLNKVPA